MPFEQAIPLLTQITQDHTVPRNVKERISECIKVLQDEKSEIKMRASQVIAELDEISGDSNLPTYARTALWSAVSIIEGEKEK